MGISNPPLPFSFRSSCPKYVPPQLLVLILASPTSGGGRKLNSPGCLHLVGPALCCPNLDWDLEVGDTRRGHPCQAQLTGSHPPGELRDLAKTVRCSQIFHSLQIFAALEIAASQTCECFPTWLCGLRPPSRAKREWEPPAGACACSHSEHERREQVYA